MKFVHTGDIHWGMHPDSGKPWSQERAQAIQDTFRSIVEQAGKLEADCLFISGDLFHRQPLMKDYCTSSKIGRRRVWLHAFF